VQHVDFSLDEVTLNGWVMVMKDTLLLDWFPNHLWIEQPDIMLDIIFN
jgi:hypothetical protein